MAMVPMGARARSGCGFLFQERGQTPQPSWEGLESKGDLLFHFCPALLDSTMAARSSDFLGTASWQMVSGFAPEAFLPVFCE